MPYPTVFLRPRRKRDFVSIGQAAKRGFGLAGAGKHLGVNHSTVSRRLGQIEQHLGTRLFERGRARYRLTPCGVEMVSLAERMFQEIIGFERRASGQDMRPSGELRVTTSDVLLRHLLSAVLVTFRRAYPEITLDIVVSNQRLDLRKRDADVACGRPMTARSRSRAPTLRAWAGRYLEPLRWRTNRLTRCATVGAPIGSLSPVACRSRP
jgi:DNA-binding transcriptional LysR family regulator